MTDNPPPLSATDRLNSNLEELNRYLRCMLPPRCVNCPYGRFVHGPDYPLGRCVANPPNWGGGHEGEFPLVAVDSFCDRHPKRQADASSDRTPKTKDPQP
jgi:hypothetical protein